MEESYIPKYEDTEHAKKLKIKQLLESKPDNLFENLFVEPKLTVKCKKCGKLYKSEGSTKFYSGYFKDNGFCVDCFNESFKNRKLTEEETDVIASKFVERSKERRGLYDYPPTLPEFLSKEQSEQVWARIEEIRAKEADEEERKIKEDYRKQVIEIMARAGYEEGDLTSNYIDLHAEFLREIDRRIDDACQRNRSPRDIIFG